MSDATLTLFWLWLGMAYAVSGFAGRVIFAARTTGLLRRMLASIFAAVVGCIICTILPLTVLDIVYGEIDDAAALSLIMAFVFLVGKALISIALIGVVIGSLSVRGNRGGWPLAAEK